MVIMAISGIETLRQLGLLGKASFKAVKSLTAWEKLQQAKATAKDSQKCCCFLGLKENKLSSLLKVSQWRDFKRKMDATTQNLDCNKTINQFGVE